MARHSGYRRNSITGRGLRVPMDRERRAQFRAKLRMWRGPHRISANAEDVALALLNMLGDDGRLDPSHAHLASVSGTKERTLRDCLNRLAECGFVIWNRRMIVTPGGPPRQTSNAYVLVVPRVPPAEPPGGSFCRRVSQEKVFLIVEAGAPSPPEVQTAAKERLRALGVALEADW